MLIIENPVDLRRGDLMFGPIHGLSGLGVGFGQLFLSIAEPVVAFSDPHKWFKYRHCGVVTREFSPSKAPQPGFPDGRGSLAARLVQAEPGGAEEVDIDGDLWTPEFAYIRPNYSVSGQGNAVADAAQSFIGTPYDYVTYGAIPLYRRGLHTKRIENIISGTDTMMCSRLLDAALEKGGWHLFNDGRLRGNVTPSEAYNRVLQMPLLALSDI